MVHKPYKTTLDFSGRPEAAAAAALPLSAVTASDSLSKIIGLYAEYTFMLPSFFYNCNSTSNKLIMSGLSIQQQ